MDIIRAKVTSNLVIKAGELKETIDALKAAENLKIYMEILEKDCSYDNTIELVKPKIEPLIKYYETEYKKTMKEIEKL